MSEATDVRAAIATRPVRGALAVPFASSPREVAEVGAVFGGALLVYGLLAAPYGYPPYMDAYYYVDVGHALAAGRGFTEHFVWNYLPPPAAITHPSSTYWLPFFSVLIAASIKAFGGGYWVERLPALLCAAAYVAATYALAKHLLGAGPARLSSAVADEGEGPIGAATNLAAGEDSHPRRPTVRSRGKARRGMGHASGPLCAAGLVLFNGIWWHDFTSPDAFVCYALLATLSLAALGAAVAARETGERPASALLAVAGLCAGLASLTRQEGVLLLLTALVVLPVGLRRSGGARYSTWRATVLFLGAYAVVVAPWLLHLLAAGGPLSGGLQTLWLRSYGDFFTYEAGLSPASYVAWGWTNIVQSKEAALLFLVSFWTFLWQIFLVPLLVVGLLVQRRNPVYRPFLVYGALLAVVMPLLFTFPGTQGTLQHASMSLLCFAACAIAAGLEHLTRSRSSAMRWVLTIAVVLVAASVSLWSAHRSFDATAGERQSVRAAVDWLDRHVAPSVAAMVDDPPAYAYYSSRPTIIRPLNGLPAILSAARRYGVRYWVTSAGEDPLPGQRGQASAVRLVARLPGEMRIYRFVVAPPIRPNE